MNALLFLAPLSLFLETGLPIGLFVPGGDTLLLALGALAAAGGLEAFPLLPLLFFLLLLLLLPVRTLMSAPFSTRYCTTSRWPMSPA